MKRRTLLAASTSLAGLGVHAQPRPASELLRIAIISPNTGVLSQFGASNVYAHQLLAPRLAAGLATTHLGQREVRLEIHDAASSSLKAASLTSALVADGVHMVLASATPDICNPVSDVCEAAGVPCITTVAPWQSWFFGRKGNPDKGFRWTYHFFLGMEDFTDVYSTLFARAGLGHTVGGIWPDDVDGTAFLGSFPRALSARGITLFDPGRLKLAAPDHAAIATALRDAKVQIVTGVLSPPIALDFLKAAQHVGYRPRMAAFAKAFPFPDTVSQASQPGMVLTNEVWWSPAWPFSSGLTGASASEVAREYESTTGKQWVQTVGVFACADRSRGPDGAKRHPGHSRRSARCTQPPSGENRSRPHQLHRTPPQSQRLFYPGRGGAVAQKRAGALGTGSSGQHPITVHPHHRPVHHGRKMIYLPHRDFHHDIEHDHP